MCVCVRVCVGPPHLAGGSEWNLRSVMLNLQSLWSQKQAGESPTSQLLYNNVFVAMSKKHSQPGR